MDIDGDPGSRPIPRDPGTGSGLPGSAAGQHPAGYPRTGTAAQELAGIAARLGIIGTHLAEQADTMVPAELGRTLVALEEVSHRLDVLQWTAAAAVDRQNIARTGETEARFAWDVPEGEGRSQYRDTPEFLQERIHISRGEAARRIGLGHAIAPRTGISGAPLAPQLPALAGAAAAGGIASGAAAVIKKALDQVRRMAPPDVLQVMEETLTQQARLVNEDQLARYARQLVNRIDQDGAEPTEEELKASQGLFLRGRRRGLYRMEIAATAEQNEALVTFLHSFANPRSGTATATGPGGTVDGSAAPEGTAGEPWPERRTRAQKMLDGLVCAAGAALASGELAGTGRLPGTGGMRPQILAVIDYRDLLADLRTAAGRDEAGTDKDGRQAAGIPGRGVFSPGLFSSAMFAFGGPVNPKTIRTLACDAGIIPVVLGGDGEVLDIGRTQYEFPPAIRKALTARDRGCSFPGCPVPAAWTQAHHVSWWSRGGTTAIGNGTLLCSHHHHLIHEGNWIIDMVRGIPWFTPPGYVDPARAPRRNTWWDTPAPPPPRTQAAA